MSDRADPMMQTVVQLLGMALQEEIDDHSVSDEMVQVHVDITGVTGGVRFTLRMEPFGPLESPGGAA